MITTEMFGKKCWKNRFFLGFATSWPLCWRWQGPESRDFNASDSYAGDWGTNFSIVKNVNVLNDKLVAITFFKLFSVSVISLISHSFPCLLFRIFSTGVPAMFSVFCLLHRFFPVYFSSIVLCLFLQPS